MHKEISTPPDLQSVYSLICDKCLFFFRFLRSISYREFTRLVYGILGNRRIPLPSCAYTMIRKTFPVEKEEDITGFIDTE